MKTTKKIISFLLCVVMLLSMPIATKAASGKFISVNIVITSVAGDKVKIPETVYTDGEYLYLSTDQLASYTAYVYDAENSAFVREGQKYNNALSLTTVNYNKKKVTVKMMKQEKEYKLHDVYKFGSEFYLPLDQMAAYLKASVKVKGTDIKILNSGYSIADAAYDFDETQCMLNSDDIVDDIFYGDEDLFNKVCVLNYFSSTIFGVRIKNLVLSISDALFNSDLANVDSFEEFLTNCMTKNDDFYKSQSSENEFRERVNLANETMGHFDSLNSKLKSNATVVTEAYELFTDTNDIANLDLEYIQAKNWKGVYSGMAKFYSYVDYFTKALSMSEDNKDMLKVLYDKCPSDGSAFSVGMAKVYNKFGTDFFKGMISTVGDTLVDTAIETVLEDLGAAPYTAVIKSVNEFFKLCGVDLTYNGTYSILIGCMVVLELNRVSSDFYHSAASSSSASEKYRTSSIFALRAMKQAYLDGNALNEKYNEYKGLYDDKINEVEARMELYYRASESQGYDDFKSLKELIEKNQKQISSSGIISNAPTAEKPSGQKNRKYIYTDEELANLQLEEQLETVNDEQCLYWDTPDYRFIYCTSTESEKHSKKFDWKTEDGEVFDPYYSCIKRIDLKTKKEKIIINDATSGLVVSNGHVYYKSFQYSKSKSNYSDGVEYVRCDFDGKNREVLYKSDYSPYGAGMGESPYFFVTNDSVYISKYDIVRVDLKTKKQATVFYGSKGAVKGQRYIKIYYVGSSCYFMLEDNQPDEWSYINSYFYYNPKDGLKKIFSVEGDIMSGNDTYNYKTIIIGQKTQSSRGEEYSGVDLVLRKNHINNSSFYFTDKTSGDTWMYNYSTKRLIKQ